MTDVVRTAVMDPELKAKWLEALRSGHYAQTREYLRQDGGYCCLGVLCDVVDPEAWGEEDRWQYADEGDIDAEICELPESFRHRAGITDRAQSVLIELNDCEEATFEQIADYIEANL
jgi:hypothetical protein